MSEEQFVRNCAPTLAAIKTGSLFCCKFSTREEIMGQLDRLNRRLSPRGLQVMALRCDPERTLIYAYRPALLAADLRSRKAAGLLRRFGYPEGKPDDALRLLSEKLQDRTDFPHEIGLFLGYPPEDVEGFIRNGAKNCKCVGYWKVYGDEKKARQLFESYRRCTEVYCRRLKSGFSLERLTAHR